MADGANVIFDTIVNNPSPDITYNAATGEFTITEPGNYYVTWWVSADGAEAEPNIIFTVEMNGAPVASASSPAPLVTLQLNGSALLTVAAAPATVSLVNNTGAPVSFGVNPTQANMIILEATL